MIGHNKYAKAILWQLSPSKFVLQQIIKILKNSVCFQLYFLTNEITSVYDSGVCFIEYVFEFYFQWNNSSYIFWDSRVWTPLRPKLDS